MVSEQDRLEYDSVEELEESIDQVYDRADRLNKEMSILEDQIESFLNYTHHPEILEEVSEYVQENLPDEALPILAKRNAFKHLDNPERAENWDKLEEAVEKTREASERFKDTYNTLWNEFGYSGEKLNKKIEGHFPLDAFFRSWEEKPYELFEQQENYDRKVFVEAEGSRPTMARYFEIEDPTSKQIDDMSREKQFEQEEMREEYGRTFEDEEKHNFERHQLSQDDPENPSSKARWVNTELMMLETTLEGTPYPFREEFEDAAAD